MMIQTTTPYSNHADAANVDETLRRQMVSELH